MTIAELIELLTKLPPELPIHLAIMEFGDLYKTNIDIMLGDKGGCYLISAVSIKLVEDDKFVVIKENDK